jgi:lysophospholipase L1-like esterase
MHQLTQQAHAITQPRAWRLARPAALALVLLQGPVHAEVIKDAGQAEPAALVCPVVPAPAKKRPARKPRPAPSAAGQAPPAFGPKEPDLSSLQPIPGLQRREALRIALWGDSHAASGFVSDGLIQGLGFSSSQVQPSFIPTTFAVPGVRVGIEKACVGPGWSLSHAYRAKAGNSLFPRSLTRAGTGQSGSYVWLDFRSAGRREGLRALDVALSHPASPDSATSVLAVSLNDAPETIVSLDRSKDRLLQLRPAKGVKTLKLRLISGELALDGLTPYYSDKPKLLLDTFGIPGATARGWELIDPAALREGDAPGYDAVLLAYGTNEGNDADYEAGRYAAGLRAALTNLRAAYPSSACVLIGPPDRGVHAQGDSPLRPEHYSRIHRAIAQTQKRVGEEFGCQLWDWQSFMGGAGSAYGWLAQSPPLMAGDLIHLSAQGYRLSGQRLGQQLRGN